MKKRNVLFAILIIAISIIAYSFRLWEKTETDLNLQYKVDSRYGTNITKEYLHNATSVLDIVPKVATGWWKMDYQSVVVSILEEEGESTAVGTSKELNLNQITLLRSADYSTNFYIKARGITNQLEAAQIEEYVYYITVIPEKEAKYLGGLEALINYIKEGSKEHTVGIHQDKLRPGQFSFTITKEGTIADVELLSTSGYPTMDKTLLDLIKNMPQKWQPATNLKGEKVDQEFVFFFGMEGC